MDPYRLAHVSDPHLFTDPAGVLRGVVTRPGWEAVLAEVEAGQPDLVLLTGDLSEFAETEAYRQIRRDLERFPEVFVLPGNHDAAPSYREVFPGSAVRERCLGAGWTLLALDSSPGSLSEEDLGACEERLESLDRVVLALHHPLVAYGFPIFDEVHAMADRDAVYARLRRYPSLRLVLHGHVHGDHSLEDAREDLPEARPVLHLAGLATSFLLDCHPREPRYQVLHDVGFRWVELGQTIATRAVHLREGWGRTSVPEALPHPDDYPGPIPGRGEE